MQIDYDLRGVVASPEQTARLAFALSNTERGFFFASGHALEALGGERFVWVESRPASAFLESLRSLRPEVLVTGWTTPAALSRELENPDCSIRYICHCTGSVRHLVPRAFLERGGVVSNWGGLAAAPVAEHALLLALAALRNMPVWRPYIVRTEKSWATEDVGTHSLFGRVVGVHGLGAVARKLIELLKPFGVRILACSAGVAPRDFEAVGAKRVASLAELFAASEVVFECEALTAESAGSVSAPVLAALRDGGVFVNVGRGGVVDEEALLREARSGRLRLGLDVLREEPATAKSPFLDLPNVVLSPHIAGPTLDEYARVGEIALVNVRRFLRGEPVSSRVTLDIYDRTT